ncbi:MAG TPA: vitamin K epoxide reductase family protein [Solirubrobacteraceae bacterium]|nr:vitamin K epoxide reductase family protein [Solirubrobacteraceae bacterium]
MSSRTLRITLTVLTVIGLGVASYLTYVHYSGIKPVCTAGGSCLKVQTSVYSKLAGVPVALIGLLGYIGILGSLLVPESENSRLATMAFTLVGFGFSAYLTYRELFSIHAICEWCASSAVILTVMMCLSIWRFLRGDMAPHVGASATPAVLSGEAESAGTLESPAHLGG